MVFINKYLLSSQDLKVDVGLYEWQFHLWITDVALQYVCWLGGGGGGGLLR